MGCLFAVCFLSTVYGPAPLGGYKVLGGDLPVTWKGGTGIVLGQCVWEWRTCLGRSARWGVAGTGLKAAQWEVKRREAGEQRPRLLSGPHAALLCGHGP